MFTTTAHVKSLQAEIARLERLLQEERAENGKLLDLLLQRHNMTPVHAEPTPVPAAPPVQIISPFGGAATPETLSAIEESWLREETEFLTQEHGLSPEQARQQAAHNWKNSGL